MGWLTLADILAGKLEFNEFSLRVLFVLFRMGRVRNFEERASFVRRDKLRIVFRKGWKGKEWQGGGKVGEVLDPRKVYKFCFQMKHLLCTRRALTIIHVCDVFCLKLVLVPINFCFGTYNSTSILYISQIQQLNFK